MSWRSATAVTRIGKGRWLTRRCTCRRVRGLTGSVANQSVRVAGDRHAGGRKPCWKGYLLVVPRVRGEEATCPIRP